MRPEPLLIVVIALSACSTPPMPRIDVPPGALRDTWADSPADGLAPAQTGFWTEFDDPALAALVARVRAANATVDIARARIVQARGQARIAGAALLPSVSATGGFNATRTNFTNVTPFTNSVGSAGLDIGYDLDLFGGNRAGKRAARARVAASRFDGDAVALVAETDAARTFVQWAALGDRIRVADALTTRARDLLRILEIRRREGVATQVDTGLQAGEVAKLETQRSSLVEARQRLAASLAALVGAEAARFRPPATSLDVLREPRIAHDQPGDLVFRRPDLAAAEARIAAARGDVQQARAAFLPSLRISSSGLAQAASFGGPLGLTLSAGASLLAPIFQGGRLRGQFDVATGQQLEAVGVYRDTLLRALAEANQAMAGLREADARIAILAGARRATAEASRVARVQYLEGETSVDLLIETQRNEAQIADSYLTARQEALLAAIDLYKALGGAPRA